MISAHSRIGLVVSDKTTPTFSVNQLINRTKAIALLLLFSFALTGCVVKPVRMDAALLEAPNQSIHVVVATPPEQGRMFKVGSQGLLDLAINSVLAKGVAGYLATLPPSGFDSIIDKSIKQFEGRNVSISRHPENIAYTELKRRKRPPKGQFKLDLSRIIESTDANHILVLHCVGYGASRSYYGFIPTSYPEAVVMMTGVLIDREHQIQWNYSTTYSTYVGEQWKQPPEYPLLTTALKASWTRAEQDITGQLLGDEPMARPLAGK